MSQPEDDIAFSVLPDFDPDTRTTVEGKARKILGILREEAPDRRLRMSELAYLANGSLSRLSNVVKRFEQWGWVERSPDPDDGRYTIAALTDSGYDVVVAAAPTHVRSVREFVLDPLTAADQQALARIAANLRVRPVDLA